MMTAPGSAQPVAAPVALLGMYTIDEQGRLTGWINGMLAGEYSEATLAGRVEVNPACTGTIRTTMTLPGAPGPLPGEGVTRIVVLDNGNEMRAQTVTGIMGKPTGTETYRRIVRNSQIAPKCTAETVRGTYGTTVDGILLMSLPGQAQPVPVPYSGIGAFAIDGRGGITGSGTSSAAGELMEWEVPEGSLQVLADCTGYLGYRVRLKGAPAALPGRAVDKIVILDDGEEIRSLTLQGQTGKPLTPGVWKRMSKEPGPVGW
jgi:hypothetical protein